MQTESLREGVQAEKSAQGLQQQQRAGKEQEEKVQRTMLYLYRGTTSLPSVSVVKSIRLKTALCHSLQETVQPIQFRIDLHSFKECGAAEYNDCCELDGGKLYDTVVGEYICGANISGLTLPEDKIVELVLPTGRITLDLNNPVLEFVFLTPTLELTPKFRKADNLHMRTAPPGWKGSRLVWRLQNATLVDVTYPVAVTTETGVREGKKEGRNASVC